VLSAEFVGEIDRRCLLLGNGAWRAIARVHSDLGEFATHRPRSGDAFLDVAKTSMIESTKRRNYHNARAAYDTVILLLEALKPDLEQKQGVDAKLRLLETRLIAAGQQF
jgi:hypothetical protein